jgi:metal-responsive CopG/Arc/MetJ family transcriptional regulator
MEQSPIRRKYRPMEDGARAIKKSFSLPTNLFVGVEEEARKEGHNNNSRIVVAALIDYLNRRNDVRVA